ncbi:hypothetical protein K7395_24805 [Streptomyces filamentosus]|uniref:Uncharacterized protein n=1 Tax=Streptomyces filamentosus TaxID=67294 RepID=A0ABY4UZM8_STRFL|nr:hypothetical protein [Streptomyces filamentosus]MYR78687.1 hypothetical protein [Streptomyces sp. SID5466]USC49710.1 hypothetical protein K7395_24805 [Streptomyces filamentosus]
MSYRYRCGTCRATSEPVATRRAARAERRWHRAREHSGLVPDDESIEPDAEHGVGTGGLLLAVLVGVLIVEALARITS